MLTRRSLVTGGLILIFGTGLNCTGGKLEAQQNPRGLTRAGTTKVTDRFSPLLPSEVHLQGGMLGTRIDASERNRLLRVDENDLLDAFERRDAPHQDWHGEHVGKFLHAATLAWAYGQDPALRAKIDRVAARLIRTQEADGYLGTYPQSRRWTSWDVWVHKYDMLGLLTYYQFARDAAALNACRRVGDLLVRTFGTGPGQRDLNKAGEHVGMAATSVLEPIMLLYRATGDGRYFQFARYIITNYDAPGGPAILASLEKFRSVRRVANAKAYEMLSNFNGLLEYYRATGERRSLEDLLTAWDDVAKNRLYITGSGSSGEHWQDDFHLPNGSQASICETCVTVTWEQMNLQLLRLTGEPRFADQAERSIYNHLLGAQKPTGDMWSYYTPLEGRKPYGPGTNCCVSSGPRGVALIPSFAYLTSSDGGLVVNLYNTGTATTRLKSGRVTIKQQTRYPLDGRVTLTVSPETTGARFPLRLRIPAWTTRASVAVNGKLLSPAPRPGSYAVLGRRWKRGDAVVLEIAMAPRVVLGDHENEGRAALLFGPLVLALDAALNPALPSLGSVTLASDSVAELKVTRAPDHARAGEAVFSVEGRVNGQGNPIPLYLTPYATAGQDGQSRFAVWLARPGHGRAAD